MKAKIKFTRIKNVVVMEVLEMDERFRANETSNYNNMYQASNGFRIISSTSPVITHGEIHLWGSEIQYDGLAVCCHSLNNESALSYIGYAKEALKEWAEHWPGFHDKEPIKNQEYVEIIEV